MIDITSEPSRFHSDRTHTDENDAPADSYPNPGSGLVEVEDECGRKVMVTPEEAEKMPKPRDYTMEWWHWVILIILIVLIVICLIYGLVYIALALLVIILLCLPIGQQILHEAVCVVADIVRQVGSAVDDVLGLKDLLKSAVSFAGVALVAYFVIKAFMGSGSSEESGTEQDVLPASSESVQEDGQSPEINSMDYYYSSDDPDSVYEADTFTADNYNRAGLV